MVSVKSLLLIFFLSNSLTDLSVQEMPFIKVPVNIYNELDQVTPARIRFTDLAGNYYAPIGASSDFTITSTTTPHSKEEGLILDEKRKFHYSNGAFEMELPREKIIIEVVKGFLYEIYRDTIDFSKPVSGLHIKLNLMYKIPESNWYSGDVHVHYIDPESALLQMKCEDLNICNLLISDFTVDHDQFRGVIEPISEEDHLIYYGQEFREDRLGHINLLNIKSKLIEPAAIPRKYQYPLNIHASDEVHQDGGHVSWAHFAAWPGLEGPLGLVLKKIDAVELLCTIDPFQEPIFAPDVLPELPMNSGLKLWYRLLNCGLQIPVTAGTDKMNNQVSVGANRVYAQVQKPFNYDHWIRALDEGKTFISNNPFILFEVNGQGPGSIIPSLDKNLKIKAEVWTQFPIDRLEIIANGELVAEKKMTPGENYAKIEFEYRPEKSCWIAARAYEYSHAYTRKGLSLTERRNENNGNTKLNAYFGTLRPEMVFAHTSPVYIEIDDRPVSSAPDALYFVRYLENSKRWLDESGSFPDTETKKIVLDAFEKGIEAFRLLSTNGK